MNKLILAVITALIAAVLTACGAAPVAKLSKPQVVAATPTQVVAEATVDWTAIKKAGPSYWSLSTSKGFKAVEYSCTLRWKATGMQNGCVIVVDRVGGGYMTNSVVGPFGVVIPRETGVTIYPAMGGNALYVEAKAKTYSFVIIDEKGAYLTKQFTSSDPQWDDKLLTEFFVTQMGGEVSTIWREGVSFDN